VRAGFRTHYKSVVDDGKTKRFKGPLIIQGNQRGLLPVIDQGHEGECGPSPKSFLKYDAFLADVLVQQGADDFCLVVGLKAVVIVQLCPEVIVLDEIAIHGDDNPIGGFAPGRYFYGLCIVFFGYFSFCISDISNGRCGSQVLKYLDHAVVYDFRNSTQALVDMNSLTAAHCQARARLSPVLTGPGAQKGLVHQFLVIQSIHPHNTVHFPLPR